MTQDPSTVSTDAQKLGKNEFFEAIETAGEDPFPEDGSEEQWSDDRDHEDVAEWESLDDHGHGHAGGRSSRGGLVLGVVGTLLASVGFVATVMSIASATPASEPMFEWFARTGGSPFLLLALGVVLIVFAGQRHQMSVLAHEQAVFSSEFESRLGHLSDSSTRGMLGQDVDQLFIALQRQDEKINNLTRATKMYGKPLVEISNQVSEVATCVSGLGRLQEQFKNLEGKFVASASKIETSILGALQSGDGESLAGTLEQLRRHLDEELDSKWEETRKHVADAVERIVQSSGGEGFAEIQSALSELQHEVAGLAAAVSGVQLADDAPQSKDDADAPPSAAGPRKGSGKNVLGAIQKLKSMRN